MKSKVEVIPVLLFLVLTISCHTEQKKEITLEKKEYKIYSLPIFDADGNMTTEVTVYDHVPTKEDSAAFESRTPIQKDKKILQDLNRQPKGDSVEIE